jgi:hypothetical protein
MAELSEWLKIMLGEVARKREEEVRAAVELAARNAQPVPPASTATAR